MIKKLLAALILVSLVLPCSVHGEEGDKNVEKDYGKASLETLYSDFKTVESFGYIVVIIQGEEYMQKIGLTEEELTDLIKLRFKNNFGNIEYKKVPLFDGLVKPIVERRKIGSLECRVWVVGDNYPIAFHIRCLAGNFENPSFWKTEFLGYGSKSTVPKIIKDELSEIVEKCAIDFFKARGEL